MSKRREFYDANRERQEEQTIPEGVLVATVKVDGFSASIFSEGKREGYQSFSVEVKALVEHFVVDECPCPGFCTRASDKLSDMAYWIEHLREQVGDQKTLETLLKESTLPRFTTSRHLDDYVTLCQTTADLVEHLRSNRSRDSFVPEQTQTRGSLPEITIMAHELMNDQELEITR
jgi:hypothetical protein